MVEQISETMKYFDNNNNEMIQENKDLQEAIDFMRPKSSNQNGDNKLIAGYSFASGELFEPTSELGYDQ